MLMSSYRSYIYLFYTNAHNTSKVTWRLAYILGTLLAFPLFYIVLYIRVALIVALMTYQEHIESS